LLFIETGFNGCTVLVFSKGLDLQKRDYKFKKEKVDWQVECLPIKIGFGFSRDRWKFFLDGYGHLDE